MMAKSKMTLAGRADRMVQAAFAAVAGQRVPDHLVQLADDLETARKLDRLRKPDRAA
jgi:hypothetical protein